MLSGQQYLGYPVGIGNQRKSLIVIADDIYSSNSSRRFSRAFDSVAISASGESSI